MILFIIVYDLYGCNPWMIKGVFPKICYLSTTKCLNHFLQLHQAGILLVHPNFARFFTTLLEIAIAIIVAFTIFALLFLIAFLRATTLFYTL